MDNSNMEEKPRIYNKRDLTKKECKEWVEKQPEWFQEIMRINSKHFKKE